MKYTELQIIALAKQILKDNNWEEDININSYSAEYHSVESLLEGKENLKHFTEYKKIVKPYWTVHFQFIPEMEARLPYVGLDIYDETGIPFELQTWQAVYKFVKTPENKWAIT
jgi:hypothetical protein